MEKGLRSYKITLVILIAIIVILTGSYLFINRTSDKGEIKEKSIEAISKAMSTMGYNNYHNKPGKLKGMLSMGGKEPGRQIPGELETKVKLNADGTYIVTFIEYWNSKDFKYEGSKDGTQSHFTTFEVKGDNVKYIKNGGDFPPELVK